jgi:hypothetical protein
MAQNAANDINFYLVVEASKQEDLGNIRPWQNLKVGIEAGFIWIKDFDYAQIHSVEVKSIPYKTIYYEKQSKLYLLNSLLPSRNLPNVLWTPIDRAIAVKLPNFNHNFFGWQENISIQLLPSETEQEARVMLTSISHLNQYIETAPSIRLEKIKWLILNNYKVCLMGNPLLPIDGEVYWQNKNMLLPVGYNFELPLLMDTINEKLNPHNDCWIIWKADNTYALMEKNNFEGLSLSSFRLSKRIHSLKLM